MLLIAFALMMLATAIAMLRKPGQAAAHTPARRDLPMKHIVAEGLAVGAVTGLVGSGGGFLVVPALALLGGMPMSVAVATSLLVIAMKSFSGLAGHLAGVQIGWGIALAVTAAAVAGSLIGSRFAGRIPQHLLGKAFGWFVVVMGVFVLSQQLGPAVWTSPLTWAGIGLVGAAAAWRIVRVPRRGPIATGRQGDPQQPRAHL
ncbi:sulfite exporter TauE/SafE family protein [Nonomuraea jabiensis]|uniref:sulfite exporter TauE/SafE family protein n=1 Tax=Nonomuraea jabiensis TaxID=882448 RepID=UPI0036A876BD